MKRVVPMAPYLVLTVRYVQDEFVVRDALQA
jgi:hypothetical protein